MRIGRIFRQGSEEYGIMKDNMWYPVKVERNNLGIEDFFNNFKPDLRGAVNLKDEVFDWLPPIARPGKIICVGRNYAEHSKEQDKEIEKEPLLFSKYPSCMVGHLSTIKYPNHTKHLDYEVELAIAIGKTTFKLTDNDDPMEYIFGFTIANDLTARDVQKSEKQWIRGKSFDNSLPIGPLIVTKEEIIPTNNDIWLTVNGEKRQLSNTSNMIFDIPYLIKYISQDITLEKGDIILTGTPEGVGYYMEPKATLQSSDVVACGVTEVAELRFTISK